MKPLTIGKIPAVSRKSIRVSCFVLYFAIYIVLSLQGEYKLSNYGGADWRTEWHPRYLVKHYRGNAGRSKSRLTFPGVIYGPCLMVDRLVWHRTSYLE